VIELRGVTWDHVRGWGGLRAAAEAYEDATGSVRVTWTPRSLGAFADQPVEELAAYDLIVLDHPSIGAAAARGALVPLEDHLDAAFIEEQRIWSVGGSFESYNWAGRHLALAIDAAAQVAAFRPDLLAEAGLDVPGTWEDVIRLASAIRAKGLWIGMPAVAVDAICAFLAVCCALGADPFAGPEQVVEAGVGGAALDLLRACLGVAHPESLSWNPPTALAHMSSHDDVIYCPLAFGYVNYATPGLGQRPLRFGPAPAVGDALGRGTLGGAGLAVSSRSLHIDAACAFAAFVASPEVQRGVYVRAGGQPGHRSAWADAEVNAGTGDFFADTLDAVAAAFLRPRHDGFTAFQKTAGDLVHTWLREGGDGAAVLDALDTSYRESLAARTTGIDR
jgi:multiple sugar transport system substrate-binding protein